ncbi:MAG: hypothetical protein LBC92_02525 [Rickettsiales bacterium]|jgi:hypothetical protein|nr:hypothetical protein [Rickettsiales bacterium]
MDKIDLDKDFEWFDRNMENLYKEHGHKFLAIKNEKVIGSYDTFDIALTETTKEEEVGTFLIQECFEKKEQAINYFQNFTFAPIK